MKEITIALAILFLVACNDNAENRPTDLDRTKNNDTSAVPMDSLNSLRTDSVDTIRVK